MNRKISRKIILLSLILLIFNSCYNKESDFTIEYLPKKNIKVTGYKGSAKNVKIPLKIKKMTVTVIGEGAFKKKQLAKITIPNTVTTIEWEAFSQNKLTSVVIPNSVKRIEGIAFFENQLTEVTIPNSVTEIFTGTFSSNNLTNITIPDNVKKIYDRAFMNNNLTEITIPNGVTSIGKDAFSKNNDLTKIIIGENVRLEYNSYKDDAYARFYHFYDYTVKKRRGTYIFNNNHWSLEDNTIPITYFNSNTAGIIFNIDFMLDMPDLEVISLDDCIFLTDISPLTKLTKLKSLYIRSCPNIKSLNPISSLTNLKTFILSNKDINDNENKTIDFNEIGQIHSLKELSIFGNKKTEKAINIHALKTLVNLERLVISDAGNLDISSLPVLQNLKELTIDDCTIDDLTPLANFPNLSKIDLGSCRIKDITPLLRSNSIRHVTFYGESDAAITDDLWSKFVQKNIYFVF